METKETHNEQEQPSVEELINFVREQGKFNAEDLGRIEKEIQLYPLLRNRVQEAYFRNKKKYSDPKIQNEHARDTGFLIENIGIMVNL